MSKTNKTSSLATSDIELSSMIMSLPTELRYKIMANFTIDKLVGMPNKEVWRIYNSKWVDKWDPRQDWLIAIAKRRAWEECSGKFVIKLKWEPGINWLVVKNIAPEQKLEFQGKYAFPTERWTRVFSGDVFEYEKLFDIIERQYRDNDLNDKQYDERVEFYMRNAAAAIYYMPPELQIDYLTIYLNFLLGPNPFEVYDDSLVLDMIKSILMHYDPYFVIDIFLRANNFTLVDAPIDFFYDANPNVYLSMGNLRTVLRFTNKQHTHLHTPIGKFYTVLRWTYIW